LRGCMSKSESFEPWKNFIARPVSQDMFYYVSPMECASATSKYTHYYLYFKKEVKEIVAYTNPIVSILCRAVFDNWKSEDYVWLVAGKPEDNCCSVEGKVGLATAIIMKRTTFKLSMIDAFKVAGGAIMKIHDDKTFTEWFLDSIGDRVNNNTSTLEMSRYSRSIAEKYKESNPDKFYEYLAIAHLAEYKESKEPEWSRRRKLGQSFLYSVHAAVARGKELNVNEICEKTLTLIRSEEKIGLPVKVEIPSNAKGLKEDDDGDWTKHSLYA